jgi:hypothetical protein
MDSKRIEELLDKYWSCETSLEEEQQLRAYFQSAQIPEQLNEASVLFKYFEGQKKKSLSDPDFESKVLAGGNLETRKSRSLLFNTMRIAAGISVLVVAGWFIRNEVRKTNPPATIDTYNDPKLAFEETKKALMIISEGFGKAEAHAKKINLFNEAQEEISKKDNERKL